jgi:hypothetical protein
MVSRRGADAEGLNREATKARRRSGNRDYADFADEAKIRINLRNLRNLCFFIVRFVSSWLRG